MRATRLALRLKFHDEAEPRYVYELDDHRVGTVARLKLSVTFERRDDAERVRARVGRPWNGTYDGPDVVEVDVTDLLRARRRALVDEIEAIDAELGGVAPTEIFDILADASDNDADLTPSSVKNGHISL